MKKYMKKQLAIGLSIMMFASFLQNVNYRVFANAPNEIKVKKFDEILTGLSRKKINKRLSTKIREFLKCDEETKKICLRNFFDDFQNCRLYNNVAELKQTLGIIEDSEEITEFKSNDLMSVLNDNFDMFQDTRSINHCLTIREDFLNSNEAEKAKFVTIFNLLLTRVLDFNFAATSQQSKIVKTIPTNRDLTDENVFLLKQAFINSCNQRLVSFANHARFMEYIRFCFDYVAVNNTKSMQEIKNELQMNGVDISDFDPFSNLNTNEKSWSTIIDPFYASVQKNISNNSNCSKINSEWNEQTSESFSSKVLLLVEYSQRATVDFDVKQQQISSQRKPWQNQTNVKNDVLLSERASDQNAQSLGMEAVDFDSIFVKPASSYMKKRPVGLFPTPKIFDASTLVSKIKNSNIKKIANEALDKLNVDFGATINNPRGDFVIFCQDLIKLSILGQNNLVKNLMIELDKKVNFDISDTVKKSISYAQLMLLRNDGFKNLMNELGLNANVMIPRDQNSSSTFYLLFSKYNYFDPILKKIVDNLINSDDLLAVKIWYSNLKKAINSSSRYIIDQNKRTKEIDKIFVDSVCGKYRGHVKDFVENLNQMGLLKTVLSSTQFNLVKQNILSDITSLSFKEKFESLSIIYGSLGEGAEKDSVSWMFDQALANGITNSSDVLTFIRDIYSLENDNIRNLMASLENFKNKFYFSEIEKIDTSNLTSEDAAKIIEIYFMCPYLIDEDNKFIDFAKKLQSEGSLKRFLQKNSENQPFYKIRFDQNIARCNKNNECLFKIIASIKFGSVKSSLFFDISNENIGLGQISLKPIGIDPFTQKLSNITNTYGTYFCVNEYNDNGTMRRIPGRTFKNLLETYTREPIRSKGVFSSYILIFGDLIDEIKNHRLYNEQVLTNVQLSLFIDTASPNSAFHYFATFEEFKERVKEKPEFDNLTKEEYKEFVDKFLPLFSALRFADFVQDDSTIARFEQLDNEISEHIKLNDINRVFENFYRSSLGSLSSKNKVVNPAKDFVSSSFQNLQNVRFGSREEHSKVFQRLIHMTLLTKEEWLKTPESRMIFDFARFDKNNLYDRAVRGESYIHEAGLTNSSFIGFSCIDAADTDLERALTKDERKRGVIEHTLNSMKSLSGISESFRVKLYDSDNVDFTNYTFLRIGELMNELKTNSNEARKNEIIGLLSQVVGILCQTIRHCESGQRMGITSCAHILSQGDNRINAMQGVILHGFSSLFSSVFNPLMQSSQNRLNSIVTHGEANMIIKAAKLAIYGEFGIKIENTDFATPNNNALVLGLRRLENSNRFSVSDRGELKMLCDEVIRNYSNGSFNLFVKTIKDALFKGNHLIYSMLNISNELTTKMFIEFFREEKRNLGESRINNEIFNDNSVPNSIKKLYRNPEEYFMSNNLDEDVKFKILELIMIKKGYICSSEEASRFIPAKRQTTANSGRNFQPTMINQSAAVPPVINQPALVPPVINQSAAIPPVMARPFSQFNDITPMQQQPRQSRPTVFATIFDAEAAMMFGISHVGDVQHLTRIRKLSALTSIIAATASIKRYSFNNSVPPLPLPMPPLPPPGFIVTSSEAFRNKILSLYESLVNYDRRFEEALRLFGEYQVTGERTEMLSSATGIISNIAVSDAGILDGIIRDALKVEMIFQSATGNYQDLRRINASIRRLYPSYPSTRL